MEVKRLYNHERRLIGILAAAAACIIIAIVFFAIRFTKDYFKEYLIDKDYDKLYAYIEKPDFSFEFFKAYMNYNYGGDIEIINLEKNKDQTIYDIKTDTGKKSIVLDKLNGKSIWVFNDYVYDWHIKVPKNAMITLENIEFENEDGEVVINSLPFAAYQMNISLENCESFNEKVLAGQKLTISMNISQSAIAACQDVINEYLSFKKDAVNLRVINEVSCVEKESGVYKEVVEQMEWLDDIDYKIRKELSELKVEKSSIDSDGIICVEVIEQWDTTIINSNGENKTTDKYRNSYFINTANGDFKIIQIKNEQI